MRAGDRMQPLQRHMGMFYDGQFAAVFPFPEQLFWVGNDPAARVHGIAVQLVCADRSRGIWLDLLRLNEVIPHVLCELWTLLGAERVDALLRGELLIFSDLTEVVVKNEIRRENLCLVAGWIEGEGTPAVPEIDRMPPLLRSSLRLPNCEVVVLGTREAVYASAREQVERFTPRRPFANTRACCVSIAQTGEADVSSTELDAKGLAELHAALIESGENGWARPNGSTVPRWSLADLQFVAQLAAAAEAQRKELTYLRRALARAVVLEDDDDDRASEAATLLLNRLGMLERKAGFPEHAIEALDRAHDFAASEIDRQHVYYNRGVAWLETTQTATAAASSDGLVQAAYPASPTHEVVSAWRAAHADLSVAAQLDPTDHSASTQLMITCRLLAGCMPPSESIRYLREGIQLGTKALELAGPPPMRSVISELLTDLRRRLDELSGP